MDEHGLFSDSDEEEDTPQPTENEEDADDVRITQTLRRVRDRFSRPILLTPAVPRGPTTPHTAQPRGPVAPREWNPTTRHAASHQLTRKASMTQILLDETPMSSNMIRGILELVPLEYSGRQAIPDAHSSIFKVHIHNNHMAIILLCSGQLYNMDLRTGQFWHNDREYSVVSTWRRVRAAAFHPTLPILMVHAWNTHTMTIIRYPTSLSDSVTGTKAVDIGAVSIRGLSTTGRAAVVFHAPTRTATFHEYPDSDESLLQNGFLQSRPLDIPTQGLPVSFVKLLHHDARQHTFQFVWQTQVTQHDRRLEIRSVAGIGEHTAVRFCGPSSCVHDVAQCDDKVVAITETHAIFVWLSDGTHLCTFRKHYASIQAMSLSSSILATASFDKSVRIWDLNTLKPMHTGEALRRAHGGKKKPQAVALCENRIVIGFEDKTVEVYRLR